MDGEDDPGESSSGSWKESKETWSCNTCRTMTRGVCLDAAPRATVSIIIQGTLPFLNLYVCRCYSVQSTPEVFHSN